VSAGARDIAGKPALIHLLHPVAAGSACATKRIMTLETVIIWLLVGLIAGWLASQLVRGGGSGVVTDIVVGIVGAFIGGMIFHAEHWRVPFGGYAGMIFVAFCGAALLLLIMKLIRRRPFGRRR
jgi:uncharacterized membrane protein YeaQ/YmgE (transglycosylase-associated protein family)